MDTSESTEDIHDDGLDNLDLLRMRENTPCYGINLYASAIIREAEMKRHFPRRASCYFDGSGGSCREGRWPVRF